MNTLKKMWDWFGKKLIVVIVGLIISTLKTQHPDWPLPSEEMVKDLVTAFLAAHTMTDITYIIKTAVPEIIKDMANKPK